MPQRSFPDPLQARRLYLIKKVIFVADATPPCVMALFKWENCRCQRVREKSVSEQLLNITANTFAHLQSKRPVLRLKRTELDTVACKVTEQTGLRMFANCCKTSCCSRLFDKHQYQKKKPSVPLRCKSIQLGICPRKTQKSQLAGAQ